MELGNILFGHSFGEFEFPDRDIVNTRSWQKLLDICELDNYGCGDGSVYDNELFSIRPYYWGDDEKIANLPNFVFKPENFEIRWYKYPFRDSYTNQNKTKKEIMQIFRKCYKFVKNTLRRKN